MSSLTVKKPYEGLGGAVLTLLWLALANAAPILAVIVYAQARGA